MVNSSPITPFSIGLFVFVVVTQIIAVSLLPRTAGFTHICWTALCLGTYAVSLWGIAYFIHTGTALSLLIPVLSAIVPLATIVVALVVYGEAASVAKVVMLCTACAAIGMASVVT